MTHPIQEQPMSTTGHYKLRRRFTASPQEVFRFFIEPEAFSQWFVVPGFRTPRETIRLDPRTGGSVEATMVAEDGSAAIPFVVRFGEVEPPRRVVMYPGDDEQVTITLSALPDGTDLLYEYEGPAAGPADVAAVQDMLDRIVHHL
jgi:uncharacterized protein YndB with AHSA1/START domain